MEITKFVLEGRDEAKLYGDSSAYRTRLSNRIHTLRKKLGITTKPRAKYSNKPVTAEDISQSHDYIHLLLLTSERAWAHAMSMKEIHTVDTKGITGSTRSHIVSRLHKATIYANDLFRLLSDKSTTNANDVDVLEARAYAAALAGAMEFEKQSWEACVKRYAEARIIYTALSKVTKADIFKDLLADPVDPSIRYGAYKMGLPRTLAISAIARKNFPSDQELTEQVEKLDPDCLKDEATISKAQSLESGETIKTIVWRSRTVDLEDAAIATALGSVKAASSKLSNTLSSSTPKDRGSAYDDILIASQEVVDATKHAIDELVSEGVGQSDKRMQSLLVTRTAVSYDMIGWRIGRNRVMVGEQDGIIDYVQSFPAGKVKKSTKDEPIGRKLAKLREKVVLYDAILQSVESIKELPGVAADSSLQEELDAKYSYFQALKCLIIARSHAILSNPKNSLALLNRATEKCTAAHSKLSSSMDTTTTDTPPNLTVTPSETEKLLAYLQCELQRYRALVEISNLTSTTPKPGDENVQQIPLVERLHEYPSDGVVDLKNLVNYPPKLEVVPVKPLFFDSAWNYIDYPGRTTEKAAEKAAVEVQAKEPEPGEPQEQQQQQQKKGWFGFGR
ncbi:Bcsrp68 [Botrytis cinerea B05.10]|uniref:Signal recognition particle subunit SRP68 n=1 Tax=Botryotinia fuckeliana (strain B05.10) TaxID=332648 RepID=A0A384JLX3_BOTFB|nr:Bcsrp68 [Botrytis cinerea B05.10]ATZ51500.1 Bcsrp68 [Botrytis cinerea B05.10]